MFDLEGRRLIIFADYGLDDAAATVSLYNNRNKFEGITIVPIGGNVPPKVSYDNAVTLLNHLCTKGECFELVDTLGEKQPYRYLADIHGGDGMGDILEKNDSLEHVKIASFGDFLKGIKGDEILLSLGPMTLVTPIAQAFPGCPLVIMGGCVESEPNYEGYEFNVALDPEAFARAVKQRHVAITLDTCRVEKLDMRRLEITDSSLHSQILRADQRLSISRGEEGCYVWDDVAACYVLHPERFELKSGKDRQGNTVTYAVYVSKREYFEDGL